MPTSQSNLRRAALEALGGAARGADKSAMVLAVFDAVSAGASRLEVEQVLADEASPIEQAWMDDVAEALGGALLAEEGAHVRLLNTAAQLTLGATFSGSLRTAVEILTRSAVHRVDIEGLLARARQHGSAFRRVDHQLVWAQRTSMGLVVFVEGAISRSSAPPPDEAAALRHELSNAMTAIAALAAHAQTDTSDAATLRALARIRSVASTAVSETRQKPDVLLVGSREVSTDIDQMVADLAPFAAQHCVTVEARIDPGLMSSVPIASLRLVVWNLLKNAIEASPSDALVVVSAHHRSGSLRLSVEDRGAGLPAALRERVFDAHFSTKDTGRGLGLSLVQEEVRRLGGRIDVDSPSRGGTRFVATLPGAQLTDHGPDSEEVSGVVRKRPLAGFRVALVCQLVFLERALSAFGASVTRVRADELESGATGSTAFDVLVADSAELSAASAVNLRRLGRVRRVVILVDDGAPLQVDGADAVLARSFDLGELAVTIERLLAQGTDLT